MIESNHALRLYIYNKQQKWLNCEIFVPTELMNNNFNCDNIDEKNIYINELNLNNDRIFENQDNLLYHPVKGNFLNRISNVKTYRYIRINLPFLKFKIKPFTSLCI